MPLPASLGTKAPGQLIKSEDWNALVAGVNQIEGALNARLTGVEAAVAGLNSRITTAETSITTLRTDLDAVLAAMFRITMTTTRASFALGELAEITATVRDAHGEIPSAGTFVDFVATWGTLKAGARLHCGDWCRLAQHLRANQRAGHCEGPAFLRAAARRE